MATAKSFEDLEVWQKARLIAREVYAITSLSCFSSDYRIVNQMRGSAGSIMDNIAEGFGRGSRLEFINSLGIAKGEANELKSQLYRCCDIGYIDTTQFEKIFVLVEEVCKMITAFIVYLNASDIKGEKFKNRQQ